MYCFIRTDNTGLMIINFQLPAADHSEFYVKGTNKSITDRYSCKADPLKKVSVHCAGARTPLRELIDINAYKFV